MQNLKYILLAILASCTFLYLSFFSVFAIDTYQVWENYPNSPETSETYPYQIIAEDDGYIRLYLADKEMFHYYTSNRTSFIYVSPDTNYKMFYLNSGSWVQIKTGLSTANLEINDIDLYKESNQDIEAFDYLMTSEGVIFQSTIIEPTFIEPPAILKSRFELLAEQRGNKVVSFNYRIGNNYYTQYFELNKATNQQLFTEVQNDVDVIMANYERRLDWLGVEHSFFDDYTYNPINTAGWHTEFVHQGVPLDVIETNTPVEEFNPDVAESAQGYIVWTSVMNRPKNQMLIQDRINILMIEDNIPYSFHEHTFHVEFNLGSYHSIDTVTMLDFPFSNYVCDENGNGSMDIRTELEIGSVTDLTFSIGANNFTYQVIPKRENTVDTSIIDSDAFGGYTTSEKLDELNLNQELNLIEVTGKVKDNLSGFFTMSFLIMTGLPPFITVPVAIIFSLVLFDYIRGR